MAEQVARIKLQAIVEGLEGFDQLKGAFKGLQQAIGPTDAQITKARKDILEFGKAAAQSESTIRGQIDALKALQSQATIGSTVYRQLKKDVQDLGGAYKEAASGVKQFTDAQLKSQIVGSKPSTFDKQIAALRRGLQDLNVYSRQYTDALTEIQRRQLPFNTALGRQNVIAGFEAYQQGGKGGPATLPALPDTTAGLNQRLSELNAEFVNLARGGTDWIRVSREIAAVQRQLNQEFANPAVEAARRRLEASRNTSSGFLAFSQGLDDRIAIEKSIARNQRKRDVAPLYSAPIGPAPPSELFRNIAGISNATASNQLQLMGRSYGEVAASIRQTTAASDGSINSLRAQRNSWEALRNSLGDNKAALREVNKEIAAVDRQLERRGVGGGGIGPKVQAFGAIASGAIFGGVEGAVGGLAGAAIGGVPGAFAGAAVGGSISMIRQNVVAMGEFSAEIAKLEIALRGVAGSAEEFAAAQQVIKLAQIELNVPVMEATKGFTQLTAAVKGAGGNVGDAEVVFRGVTEAIKATGGGAEEVQGALTAMAQIFSKGKVSAEELQGQLGERLPGAVTLFAQATGRTLPQLQKDLEQGVVGLNDVMKFAASLSTRYSEQAIKMAASTEDSTARMKVALDDLRRAFGSIVQPITASVQSIIAKLAEMTVRALRAVGLVKDSMAELGAAGRAKDLQTRTVDAYRALGSGPQSYSEKKRALELAEGLANAATPQKSLAGVQQNIRALQQARQVVRQISAEGLDERQIQLLQDYGTKLDSRIAGEQKLLKSLQDQRKATQFQEVDRTGKGDNKASEADKLAKQQQQLALQTADAQRTLDNKIFENQIELDRRRYELQQELIDLRAQNEIEALTGIAKDYASRADQFRKQIRDMYRQGTEATLQAMVAQQQAASARSVQSVAGGGIQVSGVIARTGNTGDSTGAHLDLRWGDGRPITKADADKYFLVNGRAPSSFGVTSPYGPRRLFGRSFHSGIDFGTPAGSALSLKGGATFSRDLGNTGAGGYAIEVMTPEGTMKALHLMARSVTVAGASRSQVKASRLAGGEAQDAAQAAALRELQLKDDAARAEQMISLAVQQNTAAVRDRIAALADEAVINKERFRLQMEGARPEIIEREIEALKLRQQQVKETAIAQALLNQKEAELALIKDKQSDPARILTAEIEVQRRTLAELPRLYDSLRTSLESATTAQIAFNDAMRFRQDERIGIGIREGAQQYVESLGTMREASAQLAQTGIKGVEDAIFSLVTTGTTNFRQFAAEILKQTARMIIQQMILRVIMQAIGAIPGGGGGGGGLLPNVSFNPAAFSMPSLLNANGNAFGRNGIMPFAMGGIVTKPTLFRYANGGVPGTGLMGEAGPEAIIPLRRGRDGKLGVAGGGSSTNVTVNVDATGSSVQGNSGQGEALGRAISQAVQQELIKQRRPGGLLAA